MCGTVWLKPEPIIIISSSIHLWCQQLFLLSCWCYVTVQLPSSQNYSPVIPGADTAHQTMTYKLDIFQTPVHHSSFNSFIYIPGEVGVCLVRCNQSLNSTGVYIHEPAAYCHAGDISCFQQSCSLDFERMEIGSLYRIQCKPVSLWFKARLDI